MIRLLLSVITTVVVVVFAMVNTHPVALSFIFGTPVKVRLIFLLLSAFLLGMLFAVFFMLIWRLRTTGPRPQPQNGERMDLVQQ